MLVRIPGRDAAARPILFSGHMDVVDARPEDWQRDPFTLVEENGYFFGRGTGDNKAGITSLVSTILRMEAAGHRPRRTLVFAFIGDEETGMATTRLVAAHDWVQKAEYAINTDAGGGGLTEDGKPVMYVVQGGEKTYASFRLTVRNPGGHSSRPRADNAIYELAEALLRIRAYRFPAMATRSPAAISRRSARSCPGAEGEPVRRFAADPGDAEATAALRSSPSEVGTIAHHLRRHHAERRPCRKRACRSAQRRWSIAASSPEPASRRCAPRWPRSSPIPTSRSRSPAIPLESPVSEPRDDVTAAIARSIHARYPGLPITPYQESGGTDGLVYRNAGIPT